MLHEVVRRNTFSDANTVRELVLNECSGDAITYKFNSYYKEDGVTVESHHCDSFEDANNVYNDMKDFYSIRS